MRGDPRVELRGAVLVGRRVVAGSRAETDRGEIVTVIGLLLRIDSRGLTVEGPRPNVVHTVSWHRVKSINAGEPATFPDNKPARSIQVELDDRGVQFLLPAEVLNDDQFRVLDEVVSGYLSSAPSAVPVRTASLEQREEVREPLAKSPSAVEARVVVRAPVQRPARMSDAFTRARDPGLPPPPPSSSVVMPPKPSDAGSSSGSGTSQNAPGIENRLPLPLAVPAARRVNAPSRPTLEPSSVDPEPGRIPSRLPPPPPSGSWSQLPPPPLAQPPIEAEAHPEPDARLEPDARPQPDSRPQTDARQEVAPEVPPQRQDEAAGPRRRGDGRRRKQPKKRSRRTAVFGGAVLLVAAAIGGSVFGLAATDKGSVRTPGTAAPPGVATRSSSGGSPGAVGGPPAGADPGAVGGAVNIIAAGLPPGWRTGQSPWPRAATSQSDTALSACLGLPLSHLGIVTGVTEQGGPQVETSPWFTSPSGATGFESYVVLTQQATTRASDMGPLMGIRAASCLQGWFASLDQSGDQIIGVPTVSTLPVAALSGEQVVGFRAALTTRIKNAEVQVNEELVFLGAGRVEVGLTSVATGVQVAVSIESSQLKGLERRLKSVTGS